MVAQDALFGYGMMNGQEKETINNKERWRCAKCDAELVPKSTMFAYMGMTFSHEALRCPLCGMVMITKGLADGKMAEVEQLMEDK